MRKTESPLEFVRTAYRTLDKVNCVVVACRAPRRSRTAGIGGAIFKPSRDTPMVARAVVASASSNNVSINELTGVRFADVPAAAIGSPFESNAKNLLARVAFTGSVAISALSPSCCRRTRVTKDFNR